MNFDIETYLTAHKQKIDSDFTQMAHIYKSSYNKNDEYTKCSTQININDCKEQYFDLVTPEHINKNIKIHELLNIVPDKQISTINEALNKSNELLGQYYDILGDNFIEDREWIQTDKYKRFKTKTNQHLLINTISIQRYRDLEFNWFMENIINTIKKYINTNILVKHTVIRDDMYDICWVLIIFENN